MAGMHDSATRITLLGRLRRDPTNQAVWADCFDHDSLAATRFHLQRLGRTPLPEPLQARRERLSRELRE